MKFLLHRSHRQSVYVVAYFKLVVSELEKSDHICPLAFLLLFILSRCSDLRGQWEHKGREEWGCYLYFPNVFNIVSFLRRFRFLYHHSSGLANYLLRISPVCHLFVLTAFTSPMSISHLDCCASPSYLVSLSLVSLVFQTILHTG